MRLLRHCTELEAWRRETRQAPLHFVPTMGALHPGHQSLISRAARPCAGGQPRVLVSVFVNPLQFGPKEDFARYPRQLEEDAALAEAAGADALFAPAWRSSTQLESKSSPAFSRPYRCSKGCAAGTGAAISMV